MWMLLLALLASPKEFKKAGDSAFQALRNFEVVELADLKAGKAWPTATEHREIVAKCAILSEAVHDSLILRMDMAPGSPVSPQALSLVRHQEQAARALSSYLDLNTDAEARLLLRKVQDAYLHLFSLFPPPTEFYDHPIPAR